MSVALHPLPQAAEVSASGADAHTFLTVYGCDRDEAAVFREKAPSFGVTPVITAAPVSDGSIKLTAGSRCISIGHKTPVTNSQLAALSQAGVQYISTRSIGFNHLNVDYANSVGICVENVVYSPDSVADYTLMLILMAVRNAKWTIRRTDAHDYRLSESRGKELRDLTVGVVGTGRIGAAVIDRLHGFGCRIVAYDKQRKVSVEYVSLDELLQQSDILTLHTPLDEATHHLLNRPRFELLRRGAYIVNTARGGLIDTEALLTAIESGRLGGAALDVLEEEEGIFYTDHGSEPLGNDGLARLQRLPNVIITPHTAYFTDHSLSDTIENSLINCVRFERGDAA
jgi:D-specific alpha-keto acid dehydrogenase